MKRKSHEDVYISQSILKVGTKITGFIDPMSKSWGKFSIPLSLFIVVMEAINASLIACTWLIIFAKQPGNVEAH